MSYTQSYARVTPLTLIRRLRLLPREGDVLVSSGRLVKANEAVARAIVPQEHRFVNVARLLGVRPDRVERHLLKEVGDEVKQGETIAGRRALLGLRRVRVSSPVTGVVKAVIGGRVLLEGEPEVVEVLASVHGRIASIEPGRGVTVEAYGALVQLAWGRGGLAWGVLKVMAANAEGQADPGALNIDHHNAIVAVNAPLNESFLRVADESHVRAIISPSADVALLPVLEGLRYPVALTQGFGDMPMSEGILSLLKANNGREIALDAATPERWRAERPEIIIPLSQAPDERVAQYVPGEPLEMGQRVRILTPPYLGEIGEVVDLPPRERCLESGLWLHGAEVKLSSKETVFVPFANLEHLG
jgi:hypothetical protein